MSNSGRIMQAVRDNAFNMGSLDALSYRDSPIHRLDARAKILTALVFIVVVSSYDKYSVITLLPMFLFPLTLVWMARLPLVFLLKRLLIVMPFVFCVGIFNPLFDHQVLLQVGSLKVSGGWLSFCSILLRSLLTVGIALILLAVTGFPSICHGLGRLGVPRAFVLQLLFLYRYLFVLGAEARQMVRARSLRSFHGRGSGLKSYAAMLTQLLYRSLDRAQGIYRAMLSRGFTGRFQSLSYTRFGFKEALFVCGWSSFFISVRMLSNAPGMRTWIEGLF